MEHKPSKKPKTVTAQSEPAKMIEPVKTIRTIVLSSVASTSKNVVASEEKKKETGENFTYEPKSQ